MAEAALATVGAVGSVVQLGDAALRLCRSISDFIGELQDAKNDMRHLRSTLDDTNSLMRNLIAYVRQFQDAPSTNERHEVLPKVVVDAIQHFYDSLNSLRELLPPDLSPSFAQKFRFVFNRKKIRIATSQLEGCKTSTSLALNIVCSLNNINLRDDLRCLRIDSETTATEQKTALQNSSQQASQLLTEIQDVYKQQSQAFTSLNQVDKRTSDIATQLQSIHTMVMAQNIRSRRQRSTNTFTAVDEETLAKMVRICVMKTVQIVTPGIDKNETGRIDDLSINVASQAHRENFFSTHAEEARIIGPPTSELTSEPLVRDKDQPKKSDLVRLFQRSETIYFRWAMINLRVIGLRHRQTETQDSTSCFSVELDFIPRRILNFGVSLSYTNAPNHAGYYNICPTILTFNVIPLSIPIYEIFVDDDVDSLRRLLSDRKMGIRDCDEYGHSLLDLAMARCSTKCIRYLIFGNGISMSTVLDYSDITETHIVVILITYSLHLTSDISLSRMYDCCLLILDDIGSSTSTALGVFDASRMGGMMWKTTWTNGFTHFEFIKIYDIFKKLGFALELFWWIGCKGPDENMEFILYHEFCLKLCLEAGEDPNMPLKYRGGGRPLEVALHLLGHHPNDLTNRFLRWSYSKPYIVSPSLLVLLIEAGADIYFIREVDGHFLSITDQAYELGGEHLWEAALVECGHDPAEVKIKSERLKMDCERQRIVNRQLHSAERSSVDTEPLEKALSVQGLKHRWTAKSHT